MVIIAIATALAAFTVFANLGMAEAETPTQMCPADVDCSGGPPDVATDLTYMTRTLLGLAPVPTSFRALNPSIPPDSTIKANVESLCSGKKGLTDNGDGTVTDHRTGLMWEKKTGTLGSYVDCSTATCDDPHDVSHAYQWCQDADHDGYCDHSGPYADNPPDGGMFFDFLARLNGQLCGWINCPRFAGHSDWRLPTLEELQSIVSGEYLTCTPPCIDPILGPTQWSGYWSSTTRQNFLDGAWIVRFDSGGVDFSQKSVSYYVRAVRGGS